ncbi:HAD family hydrolase [Lichenibacterium ramalinae]|uniref:D,D-heptose 1,7-bisphosphate phosphatase n=1 Tax=Lichenibacterium ramalinae TaxID=2316527 RepID=A0A4Q2RIH0_9HYPH|nr:HAD family hydrolase [Lichenibacterium ramalinae]RYB06670.1 HAD family hydrolase [Lichenibacterium ramalinae]
MRADGPRHGRPLRPAVFFDRDGVINADLGYVGDPSRFVLLPGAAAGVRAASAAGALTFLVTNQSGVARGFYTEDDVAALHRHMAGLLAGEGAHFDDMRTCPHLPDAPLAAYRRDCACRKPGPGMIVDLMAAWPVDPARSAMIGDKPSDVAAARAAGIRGLLYTGGPLEAAVARALAGEG